MNARFLADTVLVLHGLFILFVLLGGLAAWRWPRVVWLHLPAVAWAAWVAGAGRICPLTPLENALRRAAGESGYPGGFIEHYLLPAIYPDGLTRSAQIGFGLFVLLFNAAVYGRLLYRRRQARQAAREPGTDQGSAKAITASPR